MKSLNKVLALAVVLSLTMATTVSAQNGNGEFLFFGYSDYISGPVDEVGSMMEVYGILSSAGGLVYPIPLATSTNEYTVYISDLVVIEATTTPMLKNIKFNNGVIHIFEDPLMGGTMADYANRPTFVDGTEILTANVQDMFTVLLFDFDGDGFYTGTASGACDFVGGTRVDELVAAEYYLEDWGFFSTIADDGAGIPQGGVVDAPEGYDRLFTVKLTPPNDPTAIDTSTWGKVKSLYQ
jgi:hypothetical protein